MCLLSISLCNFLLQLLLLDIKCNQSLHFLLLELVLLFFELTVLLLQFILQLLDLILLNHFFGT